VQLAVNSDGASTVVIHPLKNADVLLGVFSERAAQARAARLSSPKSSPYHTLDGWSATEEMAGGRQRPGGTPLLMKILSWNIRQGDSTGFPDLLHPA
jgi:hypothetical protein